MEQQNSPSDTEAEMLGKIRALDEALPAAHAAMPQRRTIQIILGILGIVLVAGIFFFAFGAPSSETKPDKVSAANRGLAQAEDLRQDKELFGKETRESLVSPAPRGESRIPGLDSKSHFPGADEDPVAGGLASVQPSAPAQSIPIVKPKGGLAAGGSGAAPRVEYDLPRDLELRLSEPYQKALSFYASEQVVFARAEAQGRAPGSPLAGVDSSLRNLVDQPRGGLGNKIVVSAGQELTATLNETLNTDYPSVVKATITSPPGLSGAIALVSYSLGNERANAQVGKIVLPATMPGVKARELTIASVVKSGLPGLGGDVNHHWGPQIAAGLANAGLTAGALAYAANQQPSDNLGTAVLVAPVIEQGVQGVLRPINYLGRDRPITVTVPAGTEFTILVTEGFEVAL